MRKILLIEDDTNLAFMLTDGLEGEGFKVLHLTKGEEVISALKKFQPDIILLDVNLKGVMNGFEVSKKIRQISQIPIIFTTSRTQIEDIQEGFQAGNVDYLKKPFGIRELILRINELLSRPANQVTIFRTINIGDFQFSPCEHSLQIGNEKIHLQKNECTVMNLLFENKGKVLSKKDILEHVWKDTDLKAKEASLHNILSSLRTKLSADSKICIETIPKIGYKLVIAS
jgi:two-component system, OmpR family, response regulator TrcR